MDIEALEKLANLKEKGMITQLEFDMQKEKLLYRERLLSAQNEPQNRNGGENITWGEIFLSAVTGIIIGIIVLIVGAVILEKIFSVEILPVERIFNDIKNKLYNKTSAILEEKNIRPEQEKQIFDNNKTSKDVKTEMGKIVIKNGLPENSIKEEYKGLNQAQIKKEKVYNYSELDCEYKGDIQYCTTHDGRSITGIAKDYYKSRGLKAEVNYKNGKRDGLAKWFYESGVLEAEIKYDDGVLKNRKEYDDSNTKVYTMDAVNCESGPVAPVVCRDKDGNKITGVLRNDKPKIKGIYKNGLIKEYYTYYDNGEVLAYIPFLDGKQHGTMQIYYPNGKTHFSTDYEFGMAHGALREFFENGDIKYEVAYVYGKQQGMGKLYYENGNINKVVFYSLGHIESMQEYGEYGNLIAVNGRKMGYGY